MTHWLELADCVYTDPEAFYSAETVELAKGICEGCPVTAECLGAAMQQEAPGPDDTQEANLFDRHGVRGGLDPDERWQLHYSGKADE